MSFCMSLVSSKGNLYNLYANICFKIRPAINSTEAEYKKNVPYALFTTTVYNDERAHPYCTLGWSDSYFD